MKTAEDEEFERIERENKERSYVALKDTPSREQLMAEVTVLTELVRVLNDRVNELEREQAMREVQRLGQEIEQEPVAWMYVCDGADGLPVLVHTQKDWARASWWHEIPLYTAPPQRTWVGLIPEEIDGIIEDSIDKVDALIQTMDKLKEKNT
jgi:hypothetical protein